MSCPPVPFASRAPRGARIDWTMGALYKGDYFVLGWERDCRTGLFSVHRRTRDNYVNVGFEMTRAQLDELIKWYTKNTDIRWEKVRSVIDRIARPKKAGAK